MLLGFELSGKSLKELKWHPARPLAGTCVPCASFLMSTYQLQLLEPSAPLGPSHQGEALH